MSPGENKYSMQEGFIKFDIKADDIDLDDIAEQTTTPDFIEYSLYLNIATNKTIQNLDLYIDYPDAILQPKKSGSEYVNGNGYSVIKEDSIPGLLHIKIENKNLNNY